MRTPIAAAAVAACLLVTTAEAQQPGFLSGRRPAPKAAAPPQAAPKVTAKGDPNVARASNSRSIGGQSGMVGAAPADNKPLPNNSEIAAPLPAEEVRTLGPLPTGPIEPYMLTKENGPFMVLAYSFRGPEAPRHALALTLELRERYRLPAYILLPKKFPGKSNIRGVPPQAQTFAQRDDVGLPELIRTLDEAAVLVGDEKTVKDSVDLMKKIKSLHVTCLDGAPQMWHFRKGKGLSRATRTTNPFVPAELLYPRQPDVLIGRMNGGPHTIRFCPGRYTLQIATFNGRSTFDPDNDPRFKGLMAARSPLATAADDAERLAESLSKDKEVLRTGHQPYVYHDRFSSRVTIGSFDSPNDPAAQQLRNRLLAMATDLNNRKVSDTMIVPANELMDLGPIKPQLAQGPTPAR